MMDWIKLGQHAVHKILKLTFFEIRGDVVGEVFVVYFHRGNLEIFTVKCKSAIRLTLQLRILFLTKLQTRMNQALDDLFQKKMNNND